MTGHIDNLTAAAHPSSWMNPSDALACPRFDLETHSKRAIEGMTDDEMDGLRTCDSASDSLWSPTPTLQSFSTPPTSRPQSIAEALGRTLPSPRAPSADGYDCEIHDSAALHDNAQLARNLEMRAECLLGPDHLRRIISQDELASRFDSFLRSCRPADVAILQYYRTARRALDLIDSANEIATTLPCVHSNADPSSDAVPATSNPALTDKLEAAFSTLQHGALPAYVAHAVHVASAEMHQRAVSALALGASRDSDGLAQMFCLTDPSQAENAIVFASKEFSRQTQFPMPAIVDRNPNFLRGPKTDVCANERVAKALRTEQAHAEVMLLYRRNGTPFLSLLTVAPLRDSRGRLRYWLRSYIDCSSLLQQDAETWSCPNQTTRPPSAGMLNVPERQLRMSKSIHSLCTQRSFDLDESSRAGHEENFVQRRRQAALPPVPRPRITLNDDDGVTEPSFSRSALPLSKTAPSNIDSAFMGIHHRCLLIRPTQPFRILFTSPAMQIPRMIQSPFMSHVGGDQRVRAHLASALEDGRKVTAKITWLGKGNANGQGSGRVCWAHCTPLLGEQGQVGVWTILLLDEAGRTSLVDVAG